MLNRRPRPSLPGLAKARKTPSHPLCWAVIDVVITHSNRVTFTDRDRQIIDRLSFQPGELTTGEE